MSYLKNKTKKKEWLKMKTLGYALVLIVALSIGYSIIPDVKANINREDSSKIQLDGFKATFTVNRKKCCGKHAGKNWDTEKTIFDKKFFKPDPVCSIRISSKRAGETVSFRLNIRQDTFRISKKIKKSLVLHGDSLIYIKCVDKDIKKHDGICNQTIKAEKFVFIDSQTIKIKTKNGKLVLKAL